MKTHKLKQFIKKANRKLVSIDALCVYINKKKKHTKNDLLQAKHAIREINKLEKELKTYL